MSEEDFDIQCDSIDVADVMKKIEDKVETKRKAGTYELFDLSNLPNLELNQIKTEEDMLNYALSVIKRSCEINIGDYKILRDGKGPLSYIEVYTKKIIWKLLRFYTFRMFNQQKEFNHQIVNVVLSMKKYYDEKQEKLEKRIQQLEKQTN